MAETEKTPTGLPVEEKVEDTLAPEQGEDSFDIDAIFTELGDGFGTPIEEDVKPEQKKELSKPGADPNDAVRYKYFQSENAKTKNQLDAMEQQNARLLAEIQGLKEVAVTPPIDEGLLENTEKPLEAPDKPKKPSYFSREDASTNPQSDSARYLEDIDTWRNDMTLYNQSLIKATARDTQKQFEDFKTASSREKQEAQVRAQQKEQLGQLATKLKDEYGASNEQIKSFVTQMSKPESITLDHLWQLHAMKEGIQIADNKRVTTHINEPSEEFKQLKKSQSLPNSMGVLPGESGNPTKSVEDEIMDKMIAIQKKDDPFNY